MRIISFAWTAPALLAGRKSCTRRAWNDAYARTFHAGDLVLAYDRSPRVGGRRIATLQLTQVPVKEFIGLAPDADYEAEGFAWFEEHPDALHELEARGVSLPVPFERFAEWRIANALVEQWVVRFRVVDIAEGKGGESRDAVGAV